MTPDGPSGDGSPGDPGDAAGRDDAGEGPDDAGPTRRARLGWGVELTPEYPIDRVVGLAERAERAGFDAALVSCHYFNRDPFVAAARVGAATDMLVGPASANPYDTHPVALASRVATLQEETGGRAVFGVGPGDRSTLSNLGIDRDRPLRRVLETFRTARRLQRGERLDHDGTFRASDAGLTYEVDPAPAYVGGQGPHMVRMSAKHAEGLLYNASHPADFAWAADRVAEGLAERPADRPAFDFGAYAAVSVAEDGAAAREAARPPVAFIAGGAADPVLDRHGIDRGAASAVGEAIEAGDLDSAFEAVTPGMIDAFAAAGTPATVADRLAEVLTYADSVVLGAPLGPDPERAVELAGEALRTATGR